MTTTTITLEELANFILSTPPSFKDTILEEAFELDAIQEGDFSSISQYVQECSNWDYINEHSERDFYALYVDPEKVTFTISNLYRYKPTENPFKALTSFADWVYRSYEGELHPWEDNAWDMGLCSGDDDVDYNSSYLDCLSALLVAYIDTYYAN